MCSSIHNSAFLVVITTLYKHISGNYLVQNDVIVTTELIVLDLSTGYNTVIFRYIIRQTRSLTT